VQEYGFKKPPWLIRQVRLTVKRWHL